MKGNSKKKPSKDSVQSQKNASIKKASNRMEKEVGPIKADEAVPQDGGATKKQSLKKVKKFRVRKKRSHQNLL